MMRDTGGEGGGGVERSEEEAMILALEGGTDAEMTKFRDWGNGKKQEKKVGSERKG